MEIERKWMVEGLPKGMTPFRVFRMDQGYVSVRPTVRIRREALQGGDTHHILCIKSAGGLSRQEIEMEIPQEKFEEIANLIIGKPLIEKTRWEYALPDGLVLEVNRVDAGQPGEFWYAEVEFETEAQAMSWAPEGSLKAYLHDDVTGQPGQTMGAYWALTRGV